MANNGNVAEGAQTKLHAYDIVTDKWEPVFCDDNYETVAASQTDQVMGATGATGDRLRRVVCIVVTAATAATSIKDGGGSAISLLPNSPAGGIGTYIFELGISSTAGPWKITTGAGVTAIGIGTFT